MHEDVGENYRKLSLGENFLLLVFAWGCKLLSLSLHNLFWVFMMLLAQSLTLKPKALVSYSCQRYIVPRIRVTNSLTKNCAKLNFSLSIGRVQRLIWEELCVLVQGGLTSMFPIVNLRSCKI